MGLSTQTYSYNLIDDADADYAGDVQVKNVTIYWNKKQQMFEVTFEAKWGKPSSGSFTSGTATVRLWKNSTSYQTASWSITVTNDDLSKWKGYKLTELATSFSGVYTDNYALAVYEVDNPFQYQPFPLQWMSVVKDLDIIEHEVTIITDEFGEDSTPNIQFRINNLDKVYKMKPYITVDGVSTDDARVYFTDGTYVDLTDMDVSASTGDGGWYFTNGLTFSDVGSPYLWLPIARFTEVDYFQITAPTMSAGLNNYDLFINLTQT